MQRAGGEPNLRWWRADYGRGADRARQNGRGRGAAERVGGGRACASAVTGCSRTIARCRGLVEAARGKRGAGHAGRSRSQLPSTSWSTTRSAGARALLALGVVRRRARQKRTAREAIEAAIEAFETLGAVGWAETARGELGRIGGRTRAEGLTAAERRVAALVAEGQTTARLRLRSSSRNAPWQAIFDVYAKLGVRSRTELARKLQTF